MVKFNLVAYQKHDVTIGLVLNFQMMKVYKMNNAQKFINSEFNYISDNVPESSKVFEPYIVIGHGLVRTKNIAITWKQFEHIKQYLIDSEKGE